MYRAQGRGGPVRDWHRVRIRGEFRAWVDCSACATGYLAEGWENRALTHREIELAVEMVESLAGLDGNRIRVDSAIGRAEGTLGGFDVRECAGVEEVGVDLVQDLVALGDAAAVDHAVHGRAMLFHAFEDDAGMECGAFDRGEEFVLRG